MSEELRRAVAVLVSRAERTSRESCEAVTAAAEIVRSAVAAEREACAKIAESIETPPWRCKADSVGSAIAAKIRARGQQC